MKFYADASSLLIAFYEILLIIFNCVNTFYAELSISKKIFFFKELDFNNLNLQKYSKRINNLLSEINKVSKESKYLNFKKQKINKNRRNISPHSNSFSDCSNNIEKNSRGNNSRQSLSKIELLSINKFDIKSDSNEQRIDKLKTQKLQTDNISIKNVKKIYNQKNNFKFEYAQNKKVEVIQPIENNQKKINYDFNIIEIIFSSFCKICLTKNLELKKNINEKACNFLDNNLDIVSYVRNQILFQLMNETILEENIKSIVNFLCRPVISSNNETKNNFSDFYRSYEETDFNKFSEDLLELINKPKKKDKEKKLIKLSNHHLINCINNN